MLPRGRATTKSAIDSANAYTPIARALQRCVRDCARARCVVLEARSRKRDLSAMYRAAPTVLVELRDLLCREKGSPGETAAPGHTPDDTARAGPTHSQQRHKHHKKQPTASDPASSPQARARTKPRERGQTRSALCAELKVWHVTDVSEWNTGMCHSLPRAGARTLAKK